MKMKTAIYRDITRYNSIFPENLWQVNQILSKAKIKADFKKLDKQVKEEVH
jgi:hypothetical protein